MDEDRDPGRVYGLGDDGRRSAQAVETALGLGAGCAAAIAVGAVLALVAPAYAGWGALAAGLLALLAVMVPAAWRGL